MMTQTTTRSKHDDANWRARTCEIDVGPELEQQVDELAEAVTRCHAQQRRSLQEGRPGVGVGARQQQQAAHLPQPDTHSHSADQASYTLIPSPTVGSNNRAAGAADELAFLTSIVSCHSGFSSRRKWYQLFMHRYDV